MATTARYPFFLRLLHWLIALIVLGLLAVGLTFMTLGGYDGTAELLGADLTGELYKYHKSFGILLLVLMVIRLAIRIDKPKPAYDPPIGGFFRFVGGTTHVLFYLILIAMPIGGWIATAIGGFPVQFFNVTLPGLPGFIAENKDISAQLFWLHGIGGLVLAGLVVLHVAAGLRHWARKDGVMKRISLF